MKTMILPLLLAACTAASAQSAIPTPVVGMGSAPTEIARNAHPAPLGNRTAYTSASAPQEDASSSESPLITVGPGHIAKNVNESRKRWIINTPEGGDADGTSPHSTPSGGIGRVEPLQWGMEFGPTATLWISTQKHNAQAQALFVQKSKGCDSCNAMAFDQFIETVGGPTANKDVEADISQNSSSAARLHMGGFQCNQQKRNPAYGHWQIDNEQNRWITTSLTVDCPLPPDTFTEVGLMITWDDSDLSCGQYGCTTFQYAWFNGVRYPINMKVQSYTKDGWGSYAGIQHQLYVSGSDRMGNTVTRASRLIKNATYIVGIYNPSSSSTLNPALQ